MRKAFACCVIGFLVGCISTGALYAAKKDKTLELDKASKYFTPYVPEGKLNGTAAYFKHICCDCASTHDVIIEVREDGLAQYWWRDRIETRRRRMALGIDTFSDPWSAENP